MSLGPPRLPRELQMGWPLFFKLPLPEDIKLVAQFSNSWAGTDVGFYLDQVARRVFLCGNLTATGESPISTIFTLPSGYWPTVVSRYTVPAHDNNNNIYVPATVRISTSGVVALEKMIDFRQFVTSVDFLGQSTGNGKLGTCDQLNLDGISFRIA